MSERYQVFEVYVQRPYRMKGKVVHPVQQIGREFEYSAIGVDLGTVVVSGDREDALMAAAERLKRHMASHGSVLGILGDEATGERAETRV